VAGLSLFPETPSVYAGLSMTILSETGRQRRTLTVATPEESGKYLARNDADIEAATVRAGDLPDLKARAGQLAIARAGNYVIFHVIEVDGIVAVCWAGAETLIFDEDEPVDVLVRW
jgi:hypothetical protein